VQQLVQVQVALRLRQAEAANPVTRGAPEQEGRKERHREETRASNSPTNWKDRT
jgi:hypothetical protein